LWLFFYKLWQLLKAIGYFNLEKLIFYLKMDYYNLGIVFGPSFLRPKTVQMDDMMKMKIISKQFAFLIENASIIFELEESKE